MHTFGDNTYRALPLKNWIVSKVNQIGWTMLTARALPELLEANPNFSSIRITEKTYWSDIEFQIIQLYLIRYFNIEIPEQVVEDSEKFENTFVVKNHDYYSMESFNEKVKSNFKSLKKFLKL